MLQLAGVVLQETLHTSTNTRVYLGHDDRLGPVVIKTTASAFPSARAVARLRREFELGAELELDGVVRHLDLREEGGNTALFVEHFGGRSLARLLRSGPLALDAFFEFAIGAASALGALHERDVVHKDVTPANILIGDGGLIKLCDLGLASRIPRTSQAPCRPGVLAGTLPYISPEQTGRVNRAIDYRTDFYSLGASFHHALTGQPPFGEADAVALLHAHIARRPEAAHRLRADLPPALSAVVRKLMAKTAEDRYQGAAGLIADLRTIQQHLANGQPLDDFEPGASDVPAIFQVSQKLVGREAEVSALLAAFDRVAVGHTELLLVRGYSGIGKSALVREAQSRIAQGRGAFVRGKFDQLELANPLSALHAGLAELVADLLSQDEVELRAQAGRIRASLADEAGVIVEFLPALAHVIGPTRPVLELGGREARERFDRLLVAFIGAFARPDHPLVLFLDDLQWIDPTSLRLLAKLMANDDGRGRSLLLIGAYRDNEVGAAHPLSVVFAELRERGASIQSISLGPLGAPDVHRLVADSLDRPADAVAPLAGLVHQKTGGNPFFVVQFLRSLADEGLLFADARGWSWDLDAVGRLQAIDTAVDLMLGKIRRYPPRSQELLRLASCLGATFDLAGLSAIGECAPADALDALWPAMRDGLLLLEDDRWLLVRDGAADAADVRLHFAHDRVQEAAYGAIPADQRGRTHLRIGRLLRAQLPEDQLQARIFEAIHHLNLGHPHMEDAAEVAELPRLNRLAAARARAATAYGVALDCLLQGIELLGADAWEREPELAFSLHRERVEIEFLNGHMEAAEACFADLAARDLSRAQTGDVFQLMIRVHLTADRPAEGLALGIQSLARLGVVLATDPELAAPEMDAERARIARYIGKRTPADLVSAPALDDPEIETVMGLLHETWTCAVMAPDGLQMVHTALKIVRLSLQHGNTKFSACGYVAHALALSMDSQFDAARYHGTVAMDLAHRFKDPFIIPKVHNTFANFTNHWINPLRSNVAIYEESYRACLLSGDRWWGAWAVGWIRTAQLIAGFPLGDVLATQERYHGYIVDSGYLPLVFLSRLDRAILLSLRGRTADRGTLSCPEEDLSESALVADFEGIDFGFGLYVHAIYKALLLYLYDEDDPCLELVERAAEHREHIPFLMPNAEWWFVSALVWCRAVDQGRGAREALLGGVRANIRQMGAWTGNACAGNFKHRLRLMQAELARVEGRHLDAELAYLEAIELAEQDGYLQNQALANELAGRHQRQRGRPLAAVGYIVEAGYLYGRWGARRKVECLREQWPRVLALLDPDEASPALTSNSFLSTTSQTFSTQVLDLATVLRAAEAISGELDLDRLLQRILEIGLQSAGAQRGALIVVRDGQPRVEAVAGDAQIRTQVGEAVDESELVPRRVVAYVNRTGRPVRLDDAADDARFGSDPFVRSHGVRSLYCVPAVNQGRVLGMLYLENNLVAGAFTAGRVELLQLLSSQAAVSLENATLYADLKAALDRQTSLSRSFERFVPKEFLEQLGRASILDVQLGDQVEADMAVLFVDIRDFTGLSESMSPPETFGFVNELLARISPVIRRHGGFIDKYIGDAVMALFPGDVDDAFDAALAIQDAVASVREGAQDDARARLRVGVGVHCGPTMLGTIGEPERMDSTVISDAVNVASRLEGLTKRFDVEILVSQAALDAVVGRFGTRFLGPVDIKGKAEPVGVHELVGRG